MCLSDLCLVPNVVCVSLSSSPQVVSCGVRVVHFAHYLFLRSKIRVVMFGTISAYDVRFAFTPSCL